jgi:hypothetical protein
MAKQAIKKGAGIVKKTGISARRAAATMQTTARTIRERQARIFTSILITLYIPRA